MYVYICIERERGRERERERERDKGLNNKQPRVSGYIVVEEGTLRRIVHTLDPLPFRSHLSGWPLKAQQGKI